MRYSSVLATLLVAGVIGKPVADPAIDYDIKYVRVTKTVVVSGDATPEPEYFFDYDHGSDSKSPGMFIPEPAPVPEVIDSEPVPLPEIAEPDFDSESQPEDDFEAPQGGSSSVSGSPDGDFQSKVIYHHNIHRKNHTSEDLNWSEALASIALQTAQKCVYEHDTATGSDTYDGGYGQNIAAGVSEEDVGKILTNMFYNDELELFSQEFGKEQPSSSFKGWGHFTQMVWKGTAEVGCAVVDCSGQGLQKTGATPIFTVCNYGPPGNFQNQYAENVSPPNGDAFYSV